MSKKVIVLLAEGFEEIEATTVIGILRRAGIEVCVAGLDGLNIKSSRGIVISADKKLEDVGFDFDACILPGGMPGATNLAKSEKAKNLIKSLDSKGKIVAAICASPAIVLAPLGILKNKSATCYPGMQSNFGSTTLYKEKDVVVDGDIITSRGPATSINFSLEIVKKLVGKEIANKLRKDTLAG